MKRIFKYPLTVTDVQQVTMPGGALILSAHNQSGAVCIWALCKEENEPEQRTIHIIGTGNPMPTVPLTFIGTVIQTPFVWHIFEEIKTVTP